MSDNERAAILPAPARLPPPDRPPVTVSIGTSELARSSVFVSELVSMVNRAYGKGRIGEEEARHRLRAGDERPHRNRVLHIAMRDGQLVGCCSSSLFVPWCGPGCGHWGLLAVDPSAQGSGVAAALVHAAELRLSAAGCSTAGMEFSYHVGDPLSERLLAWYEGPLLYVGPSHRKSGFRICRKRLPARDDAKDTKGCGWLVTAGRVCASSAAQIVLFVRWFVAIWLFMFGVY